MAAAGRAAGGGDEGGGVGGVGPGAGGGERLDTPGLLPPGSKAARACEENATTPSSERFMFSFYVKIERDNSEDTNKELIRQQLQNLAEIEKIHLLYFKKYFSRLQFNEIVVDFETSHTESWKLEPQLILRNLTGYNAAYKFSKLKLENN